MKQSLLFSLAIILLGCSTPDKKESQDQAEDTPILYNVPSDYLESNQEALLTNYKDYLGEGSPEVDSLNFDLEIHNRLETSNHVIWNVTITGEGAQNWSYMEKKMVLANTGAVLYESDFRQVDKERNRTECGIPAIQVESIGVDEGIGRVSVVVSGTTDNCDGSELEKSLTDLKFSSLSLVRE